MKTTVQTYLAAIFLAVAYQFLFWNEKQGINVLLFFLLASSLLTLFNPWIYQLNTIRVSGLAALALCVMIGLFNSDVSKISFWIVFTVFIGFIQQVQLRSVLYSLLTASTGLLASPATLWDGFRLATKSNANLALVWKYQRLSFIPLLVLFFFFIIYSFADPEFNSVSGSLIGHLLDWMQHFFDYISFRSMLFFCSGLLIASAILFNRNIRLFVKHELMQSDFLSREKRKKKEANEGRELWELFFKNSLISLKNEFSRGMMLLALVNALLLFVNAVDVKMVWFEHAAQSTAHSRSQAVHESTYLLIFSILLAMAILIFFFRGNLNFLKQNKRLKLLAYGWIVQNVLLSFTVGIRNYYYIRDCGLAYNRIGVIFFLMLTLFGLFTLYLKIRDKKSFFYLYRINGWSVTIVLVLMSCFNWDPLIANYNLAHFTKDKLDRNFLMSLSDRALPVLIQHKEVFENDDDVNEIDISKQEQWLKDRSDKFLESYEMTSWLSWNYADFKVYKFLTTQNHSL